MKFVFEPPPRPTLSVADTTARFPVRRIFCVGRNYAKHAVEMGSDPDREPPFFFAKPADAAVDAEVGLGTVIPYPPLTSELHHEVELVVALGSGGSRISVEHALGLVFGYGVGVDLTRRDLQRQAKASGRPWESGKAFDHSAPITALRRIDAVGHRDAGQIWLDVDGERRQDADLSELIWRVPDIIAILSESVALAAGDIIMTGTPAGVGPVSPGQTIRAGVEGVAELELSIAERAQVEQ